MQMFEMLLWSILIGSLVGQLFWTANPMLGVSIIAAVGLFAARLQDVK